MAFSEFDWTTRPGLSAPTHGGRERQLVDLLHVRLDFLTYLANGVVGRLVHTEKAAQAGDEPWQRPVQRKTTSLVGLKVEPHDHPMHRGFRRMFPAATIATASRALHRAMRQRGQVQQRLFAEPAAA